MTQEFSNQLWENYWHLLGHVSEFSEPKSYTRFQVANREAVLFHDGKEIVAFDNRCPHRGARIFDGSAGNAPFLCRYHGWSYAKGKIFIADKSQFSHCDLGAARLSTYKMERLGDFFFVSPSPAHSLLDQLGGMADMLVKISSDIVKRIEIDAYEYTCFWPIAVENALEPYHVSAIHPTTLNKLKLGKGRDERFGSNSAWFTEVGDDRTAKRLSKLSKMFDLNFLHPGYLNIYLFPFSMISSTFGLSYSIQNFLPGSADDVCHFYSRLFGSRLRPQFRAELFEDFFKSTAELNRMVFKEDSEICARVPTHSWSLTDPEIYSNSEQRLLFFRQACRDAIEQST